MRTFPKIAYSRAEPARVIGEELADNGRGDLAALLDNAQGLDLRGLVRLVIVGANHHWTPLSDLPRRPLPQLLNSTA
jgi:hypothetical protein